MSSRSLLPGTPSFLIMLALAEGPASGSDIQSQIIADTVGEYLSPGTLYETLRRLIAAGLVEQVSLQGKAKVMSLTSKGKYRLEWEVKLLGKMAATAQQRIGRL